MPASHSRPSADRKISAMGIPHGWLGPRALACAGLLRYDVANRSSHTGSNTDSAELTANKLVPIDAHVRSACRGGSVMTKLLFQIGALIVGVLGLSLPVWQVCCSWPSREFKLPVLAIEATQFGLFGRSLINAKACCVG